MNVNPTGNSGFYPITDAITNYMKNKGLSTEACLTPEVVQGLQNLELHLRERQDGIRNRFDTVEISTVIREDRRERMFIEESSNILGGTGIWLHERDANYCTMFTCEEVSDRAMALSWLMDADLAVFCLPKYDLNKSEYITEEQLAQHLGDIGKRIDECFAAGEISQQEYDDLNAGLEKYTEACVYWAEWLPAARAVHRQYTETINAMKKGGAPQQIIDALATAFEKSKDDMINQVMKKSRKINRSLLAKLVQQVRSGKVLIPQSSRQTNGKDKAVGYSNGYGPFVPAQNE